MTSEDFTGWRKASHSAGNAACVEVAAGYRGWRKASYSGPDSNCVDVAAGRRTVGVRDTKQAGRGPVLQFPAAAWQGFIAAARADCV
jgi:hypothetical protein